MTLFDSLERDVSSFFVAQGSIIDTILKTVLERLAHVETRVDASVNTVNKLVAGIGQVGHGGVSAAAGTSEELEYFVLTLARQLHVVLALLFQPYASDAVTRTHERQQQLPSISHVLTENEAILMGCTGPHPLTKSDRSVPTESKASDTSSHNQAANGQEPPPDQHITASIDSEANPVDASSDTPVVEKQDDANNDPPSSTPSSQEVPASSQNHKSAFTMIHHLQAAEERRQQQEQELLAHIKKLVSESQRACQAQCHELHDRNNALLRELQHQNEKLSSEWAYHQQKQASLELSHAQLQDQQQKELERQLLAFSNSFLASQTTQEQQIARILENLRDFTDRYVSKSDLEQYASKWLQTARDDCVYGADVESLAMLQQDLMDLQQVLAGEPSSPGLDRLSEEAAKVIELIDRLLKMLEVDSDALQGPNGSQLMQSLRHMVDQVEELAHAAIEGGHTSRASAAFLTSFARQMELGTASLLEAMEKQQEGYQQALSQQQAELEMLKLDMQAQKLSDEELRKQLTACPNQEDTMRLINALKEQIQASTSDSASRMLGTVDDLRNKLAGLPTHDFLEELLHSKADRSEIDRLRLLLAESIPTGGGAPSLSKSPTRCLSCDQSLPFMHSRPGSGSGAHQHDPNTMHSRPGSGSPQHAHSRPGSASHQHDPQHARPSSAGANSPTKQPTRGTSPTRGTHHQSMVALPTYRNHNPEEEQHDHGTAVRNRFVSPFTRAMFLVSENGIPSTHDILRDLAATIESTKRRRQRMQSQQDQLVALSEERTLLSFAAGPSSSGQRKSVGVLGTPEDRKNKIPLRRTTLSDQVMYGPSITSGFIKPRKSITSAGAASSAKGSARRDSDEPKVSRPKTAVTNERRPAGGDVIVRAPSTTVVIRPFSEMGSRESRDDRTGRRNTRGV